jgi:site-specific DNA-methyltransferase (cytosine-N4-specific)
MRVKILDLRDVFLKLNRIVIRSTLIHGDARSIPLKESSVNMIWTSPPFWRMRDFGLGSDQMGFELDIDHYVERLVNALTECRRVLKNDGTLWLHIRDAFTAGGGGHHVRDPVRWPKQASGDHLPAKLRRHNGKLQAKNLFGVPWRVALALQDDGWLVRSDIIVARSNPFPEAVRDRPALSHDHLFLLSKSPRYYYKSRYLPRGARLDVWHIQSGRNLAGSLAAAPRQLVRWSIIAGSKPGDIVLDPFAGSGTTLAVSAKLGRRGIGLERNACFVWTLARGIG